MLGNRHLDDAVGAYTRISGRLVMQKAAVAPKAALKNEAGKHDPSTRIAAITSPTGEWAGFSPGSWQTSADVRDFIVSNVTPYSGDEKFLADASKRTQAVWAKLQPFFQEERKKGVLAVDAKTPSTLLAHKAGYIDREQRGHCRSPDRSALQAGDLPLRRFADGRGGPQGGRFRG